MSIDKTKIWTQNGEIETNVLHEYNKGGDDSVHLIDRAKVNQNPILYE